MVAIVKLLPYEKTLVIRRQATLFVPPPRDAAIETFRSRYNPVQYCLIRAHVTLCREDEVTDWELFADRLSQIEEIDISLSFGQPVRDGNLVTLPPVGSTESFDAFRRIVLIGQSNSIRKHNPHITLIHPRNGTCTDRIFDEMSCDLSPFSVIFRSVTLIEQVDSGEWKNNMTFPTKRHEKGLA